MEQTRQLVETIIKGIQEKKGSRIVVADLSSIEGSHYRVGRRVCVEGNVGEAVGCCGFGKRAVGGNGFRRRAGARFPA